MGELRMAENARPERPGRQPEHTNYFTSENRVRVFYAVRDLFPPPQRDWMGADVGGDEIHELERVLLRERGRLSLAAGQTAEERIRNYIMAAPEDELFAMVELMPAVQALSDQKAINRGEFPMGLPDTSATIRRIIRTFNAVFESCGMPARFADSGRLDKDGLVDRTPKNLLSLPKRDSLVQDLTQILSSGDPVGVIFIDLDNFKQVNERFDHRAGDICLERAVAVIHSSIKNKGRLYRYGGDEFVVTLKNCDGAEAAATAHRIRRALESSNLAADLPITASVGTVSSGDASSLGTPEKLIQAGDEAAIVSKHTGKNRVTVWPPSPEAKATADANRRGQAGPAEV